MGCRRPGHQYPAGRSRLWRAAAQQLEPAVRRQPEPAPEKLRHQPAGRAGRNPGDPPQLPGPQPRSYRSEPGTPRRRGAARTATEPALRRQRALHRRPRRRSPLPGHGLGRRRPARGQGGPAGKFRGTAGRLGAVHRQPGDSGQRPASTTGAPLHRLPDATEDRRTDHRRHPLPQRQRRRRRLPRSRPAPATRPVSGPRHQPPPVRPGNAAGKTPYRWSTRSGRPSAAPATERLAPVA